MKKQGKQEVKKEENKNKKDETVMYKPIKSYKEVKAKKTQKPKNPKEKKKHPKLKKALKIMVIIFVLLDNDAKDNLTQIRPRLRKFDKIHLVKSGEFEDLLPNSLLIKTLNYTTQNISLAPVDDLENSSSKVEFLEEFYRHRGLHEFKKAEFAQAVKENITGIDDVSDEIAEIIEELHTKRKKTPAI